MKNIKRARLQEAERLFVQLRAIMAHFSVGELRGYQLIESGLIHRTFRIETEGGVFCLQALHPKLATDEILADYREVTAYLAYRDFPAPQLIETLEGKAAWQDEEGTRWRLTTWLEGKTLSETISSSHIRSAASLLGRFHKVMVDFDYTFRSQHPLHDTRYHLKQLENALQRHRSSPWLEKIEPFIEEIFRELPPLLREDLPRRVVHGDPKLTNVLFDEQGQAIALIDLDTCTRHSVLVDLGDAIRSWCRDGGEDEEREFSLERFKALIAGYKRYAPKLSSQEFRLLSSAGRWITLELASRFLADTLEDNYFGWDSERYASRPEHNYARAKGMLFLARDMKAKETTMAKIIEEIFFPVDRDAAEKL